MSEDIDLFDADVETADNWEEAESLNYEGQRTFRNTEGDDKDYVIFDTRQSTAPVAIRRNRAGEDDEVHHFESLDEAVEMAEETMQGGDLEFDDEE